MFFVFILSLLFLCQCTSDVCCEVNSKYFLPYLASQDSTRVREETGTASDNKQQTCKRKTRKKGCQLDWWSEYRVWLWGVQHTYLEVHNRIMNLCESY